MAATVNILCLNGRRQNLKVSSNDTILQILERVCVKGKINSSEYGLKHQRKILDVTIPFRYANLPNHAKLEMVKLDRPRAEGIVHIALQLEEGDRLEHAFKPGLNLFDILLHWESTNQSHHLSTIQNRDNKSYYPVCIYMRKEIRGEDWLKSTTLKSLGLTNGKAVIRHVHRAIELPPPPPKVHQEKMKQPPPACPSSTLAMVTSPIVTPSNSHQPIVNSDCDMKAATVRNLNGNTESSSTASMDTTDSAVSQDVGVADVLNPGQPMDIDEDSSSSKSSNIVVQMQQGSSTGVVSSSSQYLPGFSDTRPKYSQPGPSFDAGPSSSSGPGTRTEKEVPTVKSFLKSHGAESNVKLDPATQRRIETLIMKEEEMMDQMQHVLSQQLKEHPMRTPSTRPVRQQADSTRPFDDFKFPEASEKKDDENNQGNLSTQDIEPCDREVMVFNADDAVSAEGQLQDLPDNFYNVTVSDMKSVLSDLKSEQSSNKSLETKMMRDAKDMKQMTKYSKVVVRIHFPGRLLLQGFFRPQEKVHDVYKFVEECSGSEESFYLYTTPPKEILKNKDITLFQAKLCPTAVIHYGSDKFEGPFLSEATLQNKVSLEEAEEKVFGSSCSMASNTDSSGASSGIRTASGSVTQSKRSFSPNNSKSSPSRSAEQGKVPKWFKVGKR